MRLTTVAVLLAALLPGSCAMAAPPAGEARVAVSLAYDDALASQLDNAVPALRRHGLPATFYLTLAQPDLTARLEDWRAVARAGHELGNHSLFHQCSGRGEGRDWVTPQRDLDRTSVAQMADQLRLANAMLQAIDGLRERTFQPPCGDALAAGEPYWPAVRDEFLARRDSSAAPVGLDGPALIALLERLAAGGGPVNLTFHGVGGDYLAVSAEAHEALLAHLAAHRERYWVDTYRNIARRQRGVPPGWELDWADEFDGGRLDPARWRVETGGHGFGNHELQHYTDRASNLRLEDGMLVIEARREAYGGNAYTSARITGAGLRARRYGRYEARIRLPWGQGIWPAFWLLGDNCGATPWPRCGEIDIMENIGREPALVHGTVHGPGYSGAAGVGAASALPAGRYADDFHVFAVEWEPGEIRWYRDGQLYHRVRPADLPGAWVFDQPFHVLLNVAVGGDWPGAPDTGTVWPQRMLVDYIRVYRRGK